MTQLKRLSSTVNDDHAYESGAVLACAMESTLTWGGFLTKVAFWRHRVGSFAEAHVAIHLTELDEFLACLWACWRLGKIPVLSSNEFRDLGSLVKHLPITVADGISTGDFAAGIALFDESTPTEQAGELPALVLFTSGSSGTPQKVVKHFFQLEAELSTLERLWGDKVRGTVFVSTVSHHHMFGLPFGLLWPLLRGSAFYTAKIHYPETIERLAGQHALTLITSPIQLDNLHAGLDWNLLGAQVRQIFSAGAPLSSETADYCLEHFGRAVTEIYGSTETGAVAWRALPEEKLWHCLPGVRVKCLQAGGPLRISSPAIGSDGNDTLEIADAGIVHGDGRFALLGRTDRIVKVGGKRISLAALDMALARHPWVKQVRTVLLAEKRNRLGAVVALTPEGNKYLVDMGKFAVTRSLREHIDQDFDRISLPRYWRFVSNLPANTEGKTTRHALVALFADEAEIKFPELLANETVVNSRHHRLTLRIPENLYYFSGHFPGSPVLPGVVQIAWAIHYGKEFFNDLNLFSHLEAVKFQSVILPNHQVCLDLRWNPDVGKLVFAFSSAHAEHSSGRILFRLS